MTWARVDQQQPDLTSDSEPAAMIAGRHTRSLALFVSLAVAVFAADLASKYWAFASVAGQPVVLDPDQPGAPIIYHEPIIVVPYVLSLRLTTNTGAVFGLGKGGKWFFVIVSLVAVVVITRVFWVSRAGAWVLHMALALTLAGALGNLYDRIRYNAVRDMFWLVPETGLWPWIFNVADAALVVGVSSLVAFTWWSELRRSKRDKVRG